uniref:Uncharacterized protein n=1 Tax=Panagrolaimus sp. JU765 TaxID=591449 RepID=A0AC34Q677_9BILA
MNSLFLSTFFALAVICMVGAFSFDIRKEGENSYDFLLPISEQGLAIAPEQAKRKPQRHSFEETKHRIANEIYKILYDASNQENTMKMKRSEYDQKRQSLRKSNFDILAGGGLGK